MFRLGAAVGVRNPTADGSADDPYIIEGWCILPDDPAIPLVPDLLLNGTRAHVVIRDNLVSWTEDAPGIQLQDARNVTLRRNAVRTNERIGIDIERSPGTVLANNTVSGNGLLGVLVRGSDGVVLADNTFRNNHFFGGVGVDDSTGVQVLGNTFVGNGVAGLNLFDAQETQLRDNRFRGESGSVAEDGIVIHADDVGDVRQDIDASNTVNGDPVRYVTRDGVDVPAPAGQVIVAGAANVTVDGSRNVTVAGNNITGNGRGVRIHGGSGHLLRFNNIHNNEDTLAREGVGLEVDHAEDIDARWNWWGCPDGPDDPDCDDVTGNATYDPWLTSPNPDAGAS